MLIVIVLVKIGIFDDKLQLKLFLQKMTFEWSEKENKYKMFAGDEKEDVFENLDMKKQKISEKRGELKKYMKKEVKIYLKQNK